MIEFVTQSLRRRVLWLAVLTIALPWCARATVPYTNLYGFYTGSNNLPIIDAVNFENNAVFENIETTYPYDLTSVRNFTNYVSMSGQNGFRFDTVDEVYGRRIPMANFVNEGEIAGLDSTLQYFNPFFGDGFLGFGTRISPASYLLVNATNIVSRGTLAVGNVGLMRLTGKNIDLSHGTLVAGDVSDLNTNVLVSSGSFFANLNSTTGRGLIGFQTYVNPPQVYDLYWGSTVAKLDSFLFSLFPRSPFEFVQFRGGQFGSVSVPFTTTGLVGPNGVDIDFDVREFTNKIGTNLYINVVYFKTNFNDPSISADVRFLPNSFGHVIVGTNLVVNAAEAIVQYATITNDITTGLPVTNAFYLLDDGGLQRAITVDTNAADLNKLGRPSSFEVTTATPYEWIFADTNFNFTLASRYKTYDPNDLYDGFGSTAQGQYKDRQVDYSSGSYGVQVGRQPEVLNGLTINSNSIFASSVASNLLVIADPTNDAPRIEITATNLDLTSTYIRSEGLLSIKTKHLVPGTPAGIDVGVLNGELASTNGLLMMNRIVSPTYKRVRGDLFTWSANWDNTATNGFETNAVHIHVLIVDAALTANFTPTFRDLTLRGTNTQITDNFRVINSALFQAEQLTINSSVTLAQNARDLYRKSIPSLKDFFIDTNGVFFVENVASIGWDTPTGIDSFINHGIFSATSPIIKAKYVENTGAIFATNGSSMVLGGETVNLITGPVGAGVPTNTLISSRNMNISAGDLTVYGSTIVCGASGLNGKLTVNTTNTFTDQTPNFATTDNVLTNFWSATDGMTVTGLPRGGEFENDLFGTQITLTTTNRNQARVIWSGEDVGPGVDGFHDNLVVGHLVLDRRTSTSSFRFSAAGFQNAMYVDYLELRDFSFSDYRNGLSIDPNMTIYFAASNFEPQKLMSVFPDRLIWVQSFRGPNSSKTVRRSDGSFCLMNLSEATSQILDNDNDGTPNGFDAFPLDNDAGGFHADCPGDTISSSARTFFTASAGKAVTSLSVSVTGSGKVTPQPRSGMVELGKAYTFNAVPTPGNLFAGWTGDITSTQPKISFTLLSNMVVNARFVTNPYTANRGSFNGLFYDTNGVTVDSAGSISLTVNPQGGFSGRLVTLGGVVPFGGQFDADGNATTVGPRAKKSALKLAFKFDAASQQVTGTVQDDTNWTATVIADRAVYGGRNVAPFAGNYNYTWAGDTNDPVNNPGGDSYGALLVNRAGMSVGVTRFADGIVTSQTVPVSKDGNWPFFVTFGGKELAIGWVHIDTNKVLSGTINWIKQQTTRGYYRGAFSTTVSLSGSAWAAPKQNHTTGVNLTSSSVLTIAGGNLGATLTPTLTFNPNNLTFSSTNPSLSLKLIPSIGLFTGQFTDPATSRIRRINGVLLQNQNEARGFFLGSDQSGAVRMDP